MVSQRVVLDTDLVVDYLRTGEGLLLDVIDKQRLGELDVHISSITVLELFAGQSSRSMLTEIQSLVDQWRVVELSSDIARFAGEIKRDLKLSVTVTDLIIAATAIWLKSKLATRNQRHFTMIPGLKFYPG